MRQELPTAGQVVAGESEATTLFVLTDRLYRARSLQDVFDAALDAIVGSLGCERASILLFDDFGVMRFVAWRGLSENYRKTLEGHSPWKPGERDAQPIFVEDIDQTEESDRVKDTVKNEGIRALGFIPLISEGVVAGKFMTYYEATRVFTQHEIRLAVTIARQVGFSIERARAERARKISEERFRYAVEASPSGMLMTDGNGHIMMANAQAEKLFGYSRDEMVGRHIEFLIPVRFRKSHPDYRNEFNQQPSTRPMGVGRDLFALRKDGTEVPIEIGLNPIQTSDGITTIASVVDISARKQAERQREILLAELNHRVKNTLAVVQAIAQQTFKDEHSSPEATKAFEGRLCSLATAHDLLLHSNWEYTSLHELASRVLLAGGVDQQRITISGPPVRVQSRQAVAISMALHELFTNAVKYGALSNDVGKVHLTWRTTQEPWIKISWQEAEGPAVQPPTRRGFGSILIERTLGHDLGGDVQIEFRPEGLRCSITAPLEKQMADQFST